MSSSKKAQRRKARKKQARAERRNKQLVQKIMTHQPPPPGNIVPGPGAPAAPGAPAVPPQNLQPSPDRAITPEKIQGHTVLHNLLEDIFGAEVNWRHQRGHESMASNLRHQSTQLVRLGRFIIFSTPTHEMGEEGVEKPFDSSFESEPSRLARIDQMNRDIAVSEARLAHLLPAMKQVESVQEALMQAQGAYYIAQKNFEEMMNPPAQPAVPVPAGAPHQPGQPGVPVPAGPPQPGQIAGVGVAPAPAQPTAEAQQPPASAAAAQYLQQQQQKPRS